VDLRGGRVAPEAEWHLLAADSPTARNGFATPDRVRPRREVVRAQPTLEVTLPPQSVSVIVATLAPPSR
jgi:alpha-L-arabinofuranosidase